MLQKEHDLPIVIFSGYKKQHHSPLLLISIPQYEIMSEYSPFLGLFGLASIASLQSLAVYRKEATDIVLTLRIHSLWKFVDEVFIFGGL